MPVFFPTDRHQCVCAGRQRGTQFYCIAAGVEFMQNEQNKRNKKCTIFLSEILCVHCTLARMLFYTDQSIKIMCFRWRILRVCALATTSYYSSHVYKDRITVRQKKKIKSPNANTQHCRRCHWYAEFFADAVYQRSRGRSFGRNILLANNENITALMYEYVLLHTCILYITSAYIVFSILHNALMLFVLPGRQWDYTLVVVAF